MNPAVLLRTNALAAIVLLALAGESSGLERQPVLSPARDSDWTVMSSIRISYYNICTGWVWAWSGWQPGDRLGVVFEEPSNGGNALLQTIFYVPEGAPQSYGYTGTATLYNADSNGCPTSTISSQPVLPQSPFTTLPWGGVPIPARFAIVYAHGNGLNSPVAFGTDRPAAGPTGPDACGMCYPVDRPTHSFQFGGEGEPLCPGTPFFDGVCNAELFWDADLILCPCPVEPASWSRVKCLYR